MNKINPEYQRVLDILSGLPGLGAYEQQAEIGDRQQRGELVQVNEVWYERVDLSEEAAAAVRRAVQAKDEARPHDDEPVLGDVIKCSRCGQQTRSISRGCSACGLGKPSDDAPASLLDVVFVVEAADVGAIYAASTDRGARTWIRDEGASAYGAGNLAITSLAVVRG